MMRVPMARPRPADAPSGGQLAAAGVGARREREAAEHLAADDPLVVAARAVDAEPRRELNLVPPAGDRPAHQDLVVAGGDPSASGAGVAKVPHGGDFWP